MSKQSIMFRQVLVVFTYSVQVNKGTIFIISEHSGEFGSFLGIRAHNVLQEADIVRLVADLLGIKKNLVVLTQFREAEDNLENINEGIE